MLDANQLLNDLSVEEVIEIVTSLGADRYEEKEEYIIFPTICHNDNSEDASMKLYYYKENKKFHCYTECSENFNLFSLIDKVFNLCGRNKVQSFADKESDNDYCFYDLVKYVTDRTVASLKSVENGENKYISLKEVYQKRDRNLILTEIPSCLLDVFEKEYPAEWISEGITKEAMDKYNILYSISRNKIIIPHYDISNRLVGIRGRALNKEEVETFGKYMPVEIEGNWYTHPLSQNLYGLNVSKENIKNSGLVIIFEGEKSCLLYEKYFPNRNISVACCGSSINKAQVNLLLKNCSPTEIVIAFDKEYKNAWSYDEKYYKKLEDMCKKYSQYCNFSFIYDTHNLLDEKDSPIDKGKEIFIKLFENRVLIK